jgi:hypothetical protein
MDLFGVWGLGFGVWGLGLSLGEREGVFCRKKCGRGNRQERQGIKD